VIPLQARCGPEGG